MQCVAFGSPAASNAATQRSLAIVKHYNRGRSGIVCV
jgi:hypothetical protein